MIIFLYGQDGCRLSRKVAEIIGEYKQRKKGLDFFVFDAEADDRKHFFAALGQSSLFLEKKLFLIKNPVSNKDFKDDFIDRIKEIDRLGHNLILCQEGKVLKADRLLAAVKKIGKTQEFALLETGELESWVAEEFARAGRPVSRETACRLAALAGNDLWRAANEIQKLVHRISGRQILAKDVDDNVSGAVQANIFQTIDALAGRDKKRALFLIREHMAKGDHPIYLLAMIIGQLRNLVMVKSTGEAVAGRLSQKMGLHPFVLSKTVHQARKFTIEEVQKNYRLAFHLDLEVKTGKIAPEAGLDLLIAQI